MSCYIEILSVQRPFAFNVDENDRTMFSVNFEAKSFGAVSEWEEDLVDIAQTAGVPLTVGVNTFIGLKATIPTGDGPFVTVIDSGGSSPDENHNGDRFENLSAQIVVRGTSFTTTRSLALDVWRALDGARGVTP